MKFLVCMVSGIVFLGALSACGGGNDSANEKTTAAKLMGGSMPAITATLSIPASLRATPSDGVVRLDWDNADGLAGESYSIERSTNGSSFSALATVFQTGDTAIEAYQDKTAKNGTKYYYRVRTNAGAQSSGYSNIALATPSTYLDPAQVSWPLAALPGMARTQADANRVRFQFGPRQSGGFDFHAGIDLPAADGTEVFAVMAGEVDAIGTWDGVTTGSGNFVRIRHQSVPGGEMKYTAYLHLSEINQDLHVADAAKGVAASKVDSNTLLGKSGHAGASWPHLHFTYMVGTSGGTATANAEKKGRNPLEILPHGDAKVSGIFKNDIAEITLPSNQMMVRWVLAKGTVDTVPVQRLIDYYAVLEQGEDARNDQVQSGLQLDALAPTDANGRVTKVQGNFLLKISPAPVDVGVPSMKISSVELLDHQGKRVVKIDRD